MVTILKGISYLKMLELDKIFGCKSWRDKTSAPYDEKDFMVIQLNNQCIVNATWDTRFQIDPMWITIVYQNKLVQIPCKDFSSIKFITGEK